MDDEVQNFVAGLSVTRERGILIEKGGDSGLESRV
jgi:hypothetical protein